MCRISSRALEENFSIQTSHPVLSFHVLSPVSQDEILACNQPLKLQTNSRRDVLRFWVTRWNLTLVFNLTSFHLPNKHFHTIWSRDLCLWFFSPFCLSYCLSALDQLLMTLLLRFGPLHIWRKESSIYLTPSWARRSRLGTMLQTSAAALIIMMVSKGKNFVALAVVPSELSKQGVIPSWMLWDPVVTAPDQGRFEWFTLSCDCYCAPNTAL